MSDHDATTGAIDHATPGVDSVLGREVAMVVLPPAAGDELAVRTERVRRLAGLHHQNLVEIYDVDGLAPDTESALVLQHVTGRGLDELTGPWHPESLARVAAQVAAGLAHAHTHDVAHGAIGPASVVVDAGLQAWLTGFTATLLPDMLRPDTAPPDPRPGTPGDPAAEYATREIDVAALGRTLSDALGEPDPPVPAGLTTVLSAMVDGAVTAREAAERLARAAESLAAGEEDTGLIALPTRYWRTPGGAADGMAGGGPTEAVARAGPSPFSEPVPASSPVASPASVPLAVTPAANHAAAARRRRRRAHGRRAALLGAAVTAALASAFALWAGEGPSGPAVARTAPPSGPAGSAPGTDTGRPTGGPTDQGVDASRHGVTAGQENGSVPAGTPASVLPPGPDVPVAPPPPRTTPPAVPTTTSPTVSTTTPPTPTTTSPTTTTTTSVGPTGSSSTPSSSEPTTPPTTRPTTSRSAPSSTATRTPGSVRRSPAALASGR